MKLLHKPDVETVLKPLLKQGLKPYQTEENYLTTMIDLIANILKKDPEQYRAYGPFWWCVKRLLLNQGYAYFGKFIDAEWFEKTTYNNDLWDLLAAYAYYDYAIAYGLNYSTSHQLAYKIIDEDSFDEYEEFEYQLIDDDMEGRILS